MRGPPSTRRAIRDRDRGRGAGAAARAVAGLFADDELEEDEEEDEEDDEAASTLFLRSRPLTARLTPSETGGTEAMADVCGRTAGDGGMTGPAAAP